MLSVCIAGSVAEGGFGYHTNTSPEDFHARSCWLCHGWGGVAGLPLRRTDFNPRPLHVGSTIDEVTVREDFLQVHVFSLLVSCHQWSSVILSSIIVVI